MKFENKGHILRSLMVAGMATTDSVVNVAGTASLLETTTANLGTVIKVRQVNDLPLNGRNFTQLLQLTPGVAPVNTGQSKGGGFAGPAVAFGSATSFPAVNGQSNRSNFFLMDGLNNYGSVLSTYDVAPIIDAIQEFKVVSHTDSAEYDGVLGGVVNVVTKTGTDDLHGSAWEFARNTVFDTRPTFSPAPIAKADFSQNQFGGSIAGPVIIPKLYITVAIRPSSSTLIKDFDTTRPQTATCWFRRKLN